MIVFLTKYTFPRKLQKKLGREIITNHLIIIDTHTTTKNRNQFNQNFKDSFNYLNEK